MTYTALNLAVLVPLCVVVALAVRWLPPTRRPSWRAAALAFAGLAVLTAVFDNVIIGTGLVAYTDEHRSGLTLGLAPVEDFAYPLAAAIALPALWHVLAWRAESRRPAPPVEVGPGHVLDAHEGLAPHHLGGPAAATPGERAELPPRPPQDEP